MAAIANKESRQSILRSHMSEPPLYLNDDQIAVAVLGRTRAQEWPILLADIQRDYGDLPPIYERMGGRFWPEVVEFLRTVNGNDEFNRVNAGRN